MSIAKHIFIRNKQMGDDYCGICGGHRTNACHDQPPIVSPIPPAHSANTRQVGGSHYKGGSKSGQQHWDVVQDFNLDYFQGQISKYVFRWRDKNGVQDLEKARHFLDKYIELQREKSDVKSPGAEPVSTGHTNQD